MVVPKIKKIIIFCLAFSTAFTQIFSVPVANAVATAYAVEFGPVDVAEADNSPETIYDLVAIVVDTELDQDNTSYQGLRDDGYADELDDLKLGHRVVRYAEDLKDNNELTDVKILFFNRETESVEDLANALENLYRNGDGTHNNRLAGVVLVGDIPLPVVNKNGNRYISVFPYTDFSEKAYIYNPETQSFERNNAVNFPKPEIWHGVIKAPSNNASGREKLAEFFDKNHLYYEGEEMFAKFDRKLFFGDLIHEQEQVNQDVYEYYLRYLKALEDLSYFRYNKFWASEIMQEITGDLPINDDNPMNQTAPDGTPGFAETLQSDNPLANLPDIYSKTIIDQNLVPYFRLLNRFIAKVNDWSDYTGRYHAATDVHNVPALISMKDEYTKFYLRSVNDALEKKLNEVVAKIEEPLPILDYSEIAGDYDGINFEVNSDEGIYYRFHYKNEETDKFFVNGVDANIMESAKQCLPYLGSTKTEYFDDSLNFDPKLVEGVYSILTRSLRSDNTATAMPLHTAGVNTRMLSPEEVLDATDGEYAGRVGTDGIYETGAIIEDNPAYGISAFIDNPMYHADGEVHYKGPFEEKLEKNDVIVRVNGKNLSYAYTFENAIEDSYKSVEKVIKVLNAAAEINLDDITEMLADGDSPIAGLANFPYDIAVDGEGVLDTPTEIMFNDTLIGAVALASSGDDPVIDEGNSVGGVISVEFYRDGELHTENFTFTVEVDEDDDKVFFTSRQDPEGNTEMLVILSAFGLPAGFGYDSDTQGAIFTLYNNKDVGYNGDAYDDSAGCNARSTAKNGDRCFPFVASMPVLDTAGSLAPIKTNIPGLGSQLQFPEKVKRNDENLNSPYADDYAKHVDSFQFPGGKAGDHYQYEDIDAVYYDACYSGLPTVRADIDGDSNPYDFVLDADTGDESGADENITTDFYGRLLDSIGEFVGPDGDDFYDDDLSGQSDYANFDPENENPDNDEYTTAIRVFDPKNTIWLGMDDVKASEVIVNTGNFFDDPETPTVTLYDFAKRYGLFDGIDNDNDGITDYEWRDNDNDGDYETKYYDFQEADSRYGLPDSNLDEIARKLLSHDSTYTVPYGLASFPYADFDEDITLTVNAHTYNDKTVSSMIIHNEPTDYTIAEQVKSMTAFSLPIDNPRYVAFQSKPPRVEQVKYINLFSEDIPNFAQLQADLRVKANEIALIPGSYRIFGPGATEGDYSYLEISNKIFNDYFAPVVNNTLDDPLNGFELTKASTDKLHDALNWKSLNIDNKHEYILKYYLNGDPETNAYIDDGSLLPAPFGFEPAYGYEAAYLVLDGEKNYFDMNFNKDLPEETDLAFDPLEQILATAEGGEGGEEDDSGGGEDDGFEWVWLPQFIDELQSFIAGFSSISEFTQACGALLGFDDSSPAVASSLPLERLELMVDKEVLVSNGSDRLTVTILGLDENDNPVDYNSNKEVINLEVNQSESSPVFELVDLSSKTLSNGSVTFTLNTTKNSGSVTISANSNSGSSSNTVQVVTTGAYVNLYSYTYTEIVGADALLEAEALLETEDADLGDGSGIERGVGGDSGGSDAESSIGTTLGAGDLTDLERVLTGLEETENGSGEIGDGGAGGSSGSGDENGDSEIGDDGTAGGGDGGTSGGGVTTDDEIGGGGAGGETGDEILTILKSQPINSWEEYFVIDEYYQKFLEEFAPDDAVSFANRRLLAELPDDQNPFIDAQKEESKYLVENGDSFVADGKSLMKVEAQVFNADGRIDSERQHTVRFRIEDINVGRDNGDIAQFENGDTAQSENGVATIYLRAGTKTGQFKIIAEVLRDNGSVDNTYPIAAKDLYLVAGEVTFVEIQSDSDVLVANNQSKTTVNFILKDRFGNIANNSFSQIAVFAHGEAVLDPLADSNGNILGNQLSTFEGKASIDLFAMDEVGEVDVIALVMDSELENLFLELGDDWREIDFENYVGSTKIFEVLEDINLEFNILGNDFNPVTSIPANGSSVARIGVNLLSDDQIVEGYSGPITLTVLNENLGDFVSDPPTNMSHGVLNPANANFRASNLTGEIEILVDLPGFITDTVKFDTVSGTASKIELISSENSIYTNGQNEAVLQARLLDSHGNLVESDNGTTVSFSATEATEDFVEFSPASALTLNGVAGTTVLGRDMSGTANIIAKASGISDGTLSLKVNKHITSNTAKNFSPRALYISLMGGSFGTGNNSLAETLLFNGQAEAVSSLTATPSDKKRLISVDGYGKIDLLSETVEMKVAPAVDSFPYQKLIFADNAFNKELANLFIVPKADSGVILLETSEDSDTQIPLPAAEGIYVQRLSRSDETIVVSEKDDGIYLEQGSETKVKIDEFGRIFINDEAFKLRLPEVNDELQTSEFSLIVDHRNVPTLLISFKQNFGQDVLELPYDSTPDSFFPGIYVQLKEPSRKYALTQSFTRSSTNEPKGFYLIDLETAIDAAHAPGFSYDSPEKVRDKFGLGFSGNNKHMLLFSAGNSVGESNMSYASEVGIVYGDPMIHLEVDEDLVSAASGYSKDIGKSIFNGQEDIKEMINFDINGDGYDDLLLVYENGLIRLLENEISNKRYYDRGYILNIVNGIFGLTKIDVNNDSYDDLIVGTKDFCNVGEECISLFTNHEGNFVRETLNLDLNGKKALELKSGDMNADGCEDLVLSDSAGQINIFYNQIDNENCGGINTTNGYRRSFGISINSDANLIDTVFIHYPGIRQPATDGSDLDKFIQLKEFNFLHIKEDSRLNDESTKQAIDVNAGSVALGDQINYVIALKNTSGSAINNLMLSDITQPAMTLDLESLQCLDPGCNDDLQWIETGTSLRSHVIAGISVPAGGQRIIKYTMTVDKVPEVHFDLGKDFTTYPSDNGDDYMDILVKPESNPDGILMYLYSTGVNSRNEVSYEKYEVVPGASDNESLLENLFASQGLPSPLSLLDQANEAANSDVMDDVNEIANRQNYDKDYDGCSDLWDGAISASGNTGGAAGAIANGIESALAKLRCSGGCAPIPYNRAFLVPDGVTPGTSLFAAGTPNLPFFAFGVSSYVPSAFRLYLSPTLTMGLGTAVCAGPSVGHLSPCFAFAIPGGIPGVCSAIAGGLDAASGAVASAKNSLVDPAVGQSAIISDGEGTGTSDEISTGGSFGDSDDPISAGAKVNIRIPGFPSVLTNWMDKQTDEIYNKLLDFPTFYFILPDIGPFISDNIRGFSNVNLGDEIRWQSFHDFANSLSSIPLIDIEGKEILIRIPAISQKEIAKYKEQGRRWLDHMASEVDRFTSLNCDLENLDPERRNLCDKILLDIGDLTRSVEKLLNLLDQIANLPRQILNWRYLEAKYATQIICYLDAIMTFTGSYIKKQQKIVESWMKAVQDTIRAFQSWKLILDAILEYQTSCDQCKNDRFSKLGLLLQLFIAIPEPPVVPLPKWPDIIVDLSQIKTGIKILWPDVVFKPQPILLPDLPIITLPDLIPELTVSIPGFDVPDFPEFVLPNLPDLPPLPLPQLPDLPRPPRIPSIPNAVAQILANLKPIFKILCLLKNGLIPVPEGMLETEIETLTQPSIQAVIPIIKNLAVQSPEIQYDYVKEVRLTGKLNFSVDASVVYLVAKRGAEAWNAKVKEMVKNINKLTQFPYGQILQNAINKAAEALKKAAVDAVSEDEATTDSEAPESRALLSTLNSSAELKQFGSSVEKLEKTMNTFSEEFNLNKDYPTTHYLTATQTFLDPNDPLLNRSLKDIELKIKNEDLADSPYVRHLANLRNELIAYTNDLNSSNQLLEKIDDYNEFSKILVESDSNLSRIAEISSDTPNISGESDSEDKTLEFSFFGKAVEELLTSEASIDQEDKKLLAANIDVAAGISDLVSGQNSAPPTPVGFFIVAEGVNENVLNYVAELKRKTNLLFSDVDHDNDIDIILSMGGDIYLKENHRNDPDLPSGNVIIGVNNNSVSDFVNPGGDSVDGFAVTNTGNGQVDLGWTAKANAVAYEIILGELKYLIVTEPVTSEQSIAVLENFDVTLPSEFVIESTNKENPTATIKLPNGNYYASIYAINSNYERSIISDHTIVAPQSCADKEPPFPAVSATTYDTPIFKALEIDASNSFDADGEIEQYYLEVLPYESTKYDPVTGDTLKTTELPHYIWSDINVAFDSSGDGIMWNDRNNPKFRIGPFVSEGDIGEHQVILHVVDQSGNSSAQNIKINVFAPEITLDETFSRTAMASGETNPKTSDFPFSLMRSRFIYRVVNGALKLVPRIDKIKEGQTDQSGFYTLSDFNLENMILVENAEKEIVAEIHPETGNVGALEDGYSTSVNEARIPSAPTSVDILNPLGEVLGSVYLISDSNTDVEINSASLYGVNVDDINANDEFAFISLPANDLSNPGGALLINKRENSNLALIDTSGNIILIDERMSLTQKKNDHTKDPLIIELRFSGRVVAEVLISPFAINQQIVARPDVPFGSPRAPSAGTLYNSRRENIAGLVLDPSALVKRREFTRVLIEMLCIIPRPEAYEPYEPGTGYSDIGDSTEDYEYIKEGTLLNLIEGYKGEPNAEGLLPFKPENTITRAEAVKIILEALEMKNMLDLSTVTEGTPWYGNFMQAAQNLSPYLKIGGLTRNNFIVTPEEALEPNKEMTFEELETMVTRVLSIYDCYELDEDSDGMSDFCEEKYNIDDPNADQDNDKLSNADDCYYRLDPTDSDTDDGGVIDGDEIIFGTNGLDPMDDPKDDDNDGLTNLAETLIHKTDPFDPDSDDGGTNDGDEVFSCINPLETLDDANGNQCQDGAKGIYIVPAECNTCPCISTFLNKADIIEGDSFFPVIDRDYENYYQPGEKTYIFSKGNEVTIESLPQLKK